MIIFAITKRLFSQNSQLQKRLCYWFIILFINDYFCDNQKVIFAKLSITKKTMLLVYNPFYQ